ncbi:Biosynthetic arginine decarboxylase [Planctomycetes bacterium Pla163]|uniref:Biosynthetic arginine decarboxylase n=1 Tax=Rohdeia mirabilis TaxID=2528008 RepID=A0A518CWH6_9BACT|nr:Biosynthetic arginine decarboxylase [Planctomycetes bacterium Pla163]
MSNWTPADSETLYNVPLWGGGYFRIGDNGNLVVHPDGDGLAPTEDGARIDVYALVTELRRRGIEMPLLLRFDGILRSRVRELNKAFSNAIAQYEFEGSYRSVFPIKVNQQRHVVEAMLSEGIEHDMGLEVGSKPELLAGLAVLPPQGSLIICNGYKDRGYIETALLATKMGIETVIVIEKFSELATTLKAAAELGVKPVIGVRTKLSMTGSGRWKTSSGDRSKFGLTTRQIVRVVETLRDADMLDCLALLHFHMGSQITSIRSVKNAMREVTRTFVDLVEMGAGLRYCDVGGGLGVDYDGSSTSFDSSMNYSLQEYADDVVYSIHEACTEAGIPAPIIVSESGRALTAHHALLLADVLGVSDFSTPGIPKTAENDEPETVKNIAEVCEAVSSKNFLESYHDAAQYRDEGMTLFQVGQLNLAERARVEEFFWRTCEKILRITRTLDYVPDDLEHLERDMADTYFLNFSLFQSMPDSWAIDQLFPIVPIHRHTEQPSRRAVLADITCDSDGKIDKFIDLRDIKRVLELHQIDNDEPYLVGMFLVGAYQEILGDMHNLFGDTNVVHVDIGTNGKPKITHVVEGDRVREVLSYVEYFPGEMLAQLRRRLEQALEEDRLSFEESALILKRYEEGLNGYTYLSRD